MGRGATALLGSVGTGDEVVRFKVGRATRNEDGR